jgi:hypothetical protein
MTNAEALQGCCSASTQIRLDYFSYIDGASRVEATKLLFRANIMKQRITYVVKKPEDFSPEQLEVKQDSTGPVFTLKNVDAAKEHRITLGLDELPEEVLYTSHPDNLNNKPTDVL